MKIHRLSISLLTPIFIVSTVFAQRGKDGAKNIAAANTIVNEYTSLTANAAIGATSITVAASSLNANGRFTSNLAAGDLVMIYQVTGVTVNGYASGNFGMPKDTTWGRITDYYSCGRYEMAQVASVPNATTITLDCGLTYDYNTGSNYRAIVVRVPRYTSLTINSGGILTCDDWNGTIGGVVAVEVQGNATINGGGIIDANGKGFRGGSLVGDNVTNYGVNDVASTDAQYGAEKGEGVVGYQNDYNVYGGRYGRGAAGNAGGGGDAHNGGGGGGGNAASNIYNYKGYGIPDLSVATWTNAWNLDNVAIAGYNSTNSAGGGRGGYSFSSSNQNATTLGPSNGAWGGDARNRDAAGWGGRALDYSTGRIFFGGGGGAGDQNQSGGGAGGDGGGLIYLMVYGNISGSGTVQANGSNGSNAQGGSSFPTGLDAAGGGGAGGAILLNAVGTIANTLTCNTNGGNGGNQVISPTFGNTETEGPGGGGGGGYIGISNGTPTRNSNGGNNGTTNSPALSEFTPNGALKGCPGINNGAITNFTINAANVTACSGSGATLTATLSGTPPAGVSVVWYDAQVGGNVVGTGTTITSPPVFGTTTFYVGTCPGTYRIPVTVTVNPLPSVSITATTPVCITASAFNFSSTPAGGTWSGTGITNTTNGTFDPSVAGTGTFTITYSYTDGNGCTGTDTEQQIVNGAGSATINAVGAVCSNTAAFNLTASPVGGTWSGTGITNATNGTFNPAVSGVGSFTVTYNTGGACPSTDQEVITVTAQPDATISSVAPVCANASSFNLNAATSGGTWSGTGITNTSAGTFDPSVSGTGTFSIVYTISGSCPDDDTVQIVVNNSFDATINSVPTVCTNSGTIILTAADGGGTWSGTGITNASNGTFDPAVSGAGSFTITYSISGSCGNSDTEIITVQNSANATISPVSPVCDNASAFNINAATGGGTWTGTGITNSSAGTFDPSVSGAGSFNVVYTIGGQCGDDDTITVVVNATPNATIAAVGSLCSADTAITLSAATGGGNWSGTGITNSASGTFDPAVSGAGVFIITYSFTGTCPASDTVSVTVVQSADAGITAASTVCNSTPAFNLLAASGGGIWSGTGITDANNGTFDPSVSGNGTFTIYYSISGSCGDTDSTQITVTNSLDPTINAVNAICINSSPVTLTAATGGGVWSGIGITDSLAGTFDPSVSGVGNFSVTYGFGGSCAASDTISVFVIQSADASINSVSSVCSGSSAFNFTAQQSGGSWSGTGITDTINGTFDPALSGAGTFTIYYSISGSCGDADSTQITVINGSDATINAVSSVCESASSFTLTAVTPGGVWSGVGITDSIAGTFDPSIAGAGNSTVSYFVAGSCADSDTVVITVASIADATINAPGAICAIAGPVTLSAAQGGGTWSGTGITNGTAGTFDPSVSGTGTFQVVYAINGTCSDADTISLTVTNSISSTINNAGPFCSDDAAVNLSAANSGGSWSGTGITNAGAGTFDPAASGAGNFTITYAISGSCGSTSSTTITVNAAANASITSLPDTICNNEGSISFTAVQSGGTWSGTGITNSASGLFDPAISGAGTFAVMYSFSGACGDADTTSITVNTAPNAAAAADVQSGCEPLCVAFSCGTGTSYDWNFGDGSVANAQNPINCYNSSGTYTATVIVSDNNCSDTAYITITVNPLPVADFVATPSGVIAPGTTVNFTNTSVGAQTILWSFQNGSANPDTSTVLNPQYVFANTGYYCASLLVVNSFGCADTSSICFQVVGEPEIEVPNVFTPNGDLVNEVFSIKTTGVSKLECVIFDRWGLKMAEFSGINGFWDGKTSSGKKAPNGTYYYLMNYTAENGDEGNSEGFLQLIGD